ncbi:MAG: helix-turn-helix domain-containing protein [Caldilinea sp.]
MKSERGKSGRANVQVASPTIGPILRERREAMGVTLAEAEVATRIRQKYLSALESDEWDLLPGEVVGRGFLRNYSTYLGIEPTEMIERRRALADESMATVLADTSAGSPLPPERPVDYRPKDVALHDESDELETPRRVNLMPVAVVLGVVALAAMIWWMATQFGNAIVDGVADAQRQVIAWQQQAAVAPAAADLTEPPVLPENLVAPQPVAEDGSVEATQSAGSEAAPAVETNPTQPVQPVVEQPPVSQPEQPATEAAPVVISLGNLLPTPTPQPALPAAAPASPATVITAANLRQGPSTDFPIVGAAVEGQELTIIGRSADSTWYQLENGAWIFAQLVDNAPAELPVIEAPTAPE